MAYTYQGMTYQKPYEYILRFLKEQIRGNSLKYGMLPLFTGMITISEKSKMIRVANPTTEELNCIKRIIRMQRRLTREMGYQCFRSIDFRLEVRKEEVRKNITSLEMIQLD